MDMDKTGKFIASCRKESKLTQAQLAEKLGITDRAVSKWETGKSLPDASIMQELCDILGITVNELFTGERLDTENYKETAEKNLREMLRIEREKNQKLEKAEAFIIWTGLAASLFMVICGFIIVFDNTAAGIALMSFGDVIILVDVLFAAFLEYSSGYYECPNCGHRHLPSAKTVMFFAHVFCSARWLGPLLKVSLLLKKRLAQKGAYQIKIIFITQKSVSEDPDTLFLITSLYFRRKFCPQYT